MWEGNEVDAKWRVRGLVDECASGWKRDVERDQIG